MRALLVLALCLVACSREEAEEPGDPAPPAQVQDDLDPPHARWAEHEAFVADRDSARHSSDGGGTVTLEPGSPETLEAMAAGTWTLRYTAGPEGIAEGGAIVLQPGPFWGWSPPQGVRDHHPGYTTVTTSADVEFELLEHRAGQGVAGSLIARIIRGALSEGDEVTIVYGAGRSGAFCDRHAERDSRLWILVDGDGDGVRLALDDSPAIEVTPGALYQVALFGPSVVRVGEKIRFTACLLDRMANVVEDGTATAKVLQRPDGWNFPEEIRFRPEDRGAVTFEGDAVSSGVLRLAIEVEREEEDSLRAEANPCVVSDTMARIRWADLHGHSQLSDGTATPKDWWRYAKDVAGLDAAALTDHDHWGVRFLDARPDLWQGLRDEAHAWNAPGEFVALVGYEWTSWVHGHRHVLYFGGDEELLSALDDDYDNPRKLWNALEHQPALTIAHHSAGDPVPVNWTFRPPEHLEPVTEIVSVHGSSESLDSPSPVRGAIPGNTVRDQLDRGLRMGFVGSSDGHDGHPGLAHLSPVYGRNPARGQMGTGGVAAILSEELTAPALLESLRARQCYATSGPRILVDARLNGTGMGEVMPGSEEGVLSVLLLGTAPMLHLDLVSGGEGRDTKVERLNLERQRRFVAEFTTTAMEPGGYLYLRLEQADGSLAWTSPWFFE